MTEPEGPDPAGAGDEAALRSASVIGIGVSAMSAKPRTRFVVRLGELVVGLGAVLLTLPSRSSLHTLGLVTALVSGAAWLVWIVAGTDRWRSIGALGALALSGGACAAADSTAGLFIFVATAAATFTLALPVAALAFASVIAGYFVAWLALDAYPGHVWPLLAVGLLGLTLGQARRQLVERGREATLLATVERRVALADREAQLATERNRLGREIHDVLAHTLGAASIQLTALESRLGAGDPAEELRARVRSLHALVGDGLQEARDAVRALRDDELSLEAQIERVCALHGAELRVEGPSCPLRADEALALYRVVQEALTNAAKHAPDAPVTVELAYSTEGVSVVIQNGPGPSAASPLARTGGGQGLTGMRARVELVGGRCAAGPDAAGGWQVTATLP